MLAGGKVRWSGRAARLRETRFPHTGHKIRPQPYRANSVHDACQQMRRLQAHLHPPHRPLHARRGRNGCIAGVHRNRCHGGLTEEQRPMCVALRSTNRKRRASLRRTAPNDIDTAYLSSDISSISHPCSHRCRAADGSKILRLRRCAWVRLDHISMNRERRCPQPLAWRQIPVSLAPGASESALFIMAPPAADRYRDHLSVCILECIHIRRAGSASMIISIVPACWNR